MSRLRQTKQQEQGSQLPIREEENPLKKAKKSRRSKNNPSHK